MNLFQRIKTPFDGGEEDVRPEPRRPGVGDILRARREQLGLDLHEIGEALRIKPGYLAALEQGRAQDLPGPAYAVGFVRAYARHLGLDGDRVLARYRAEANGVDGRPDLSLPLPLGERSVPGGPILLVALILAVCGYGTWYYLSTGERSRPQRVAAVPTALQPTTEWSASAGASSEAGGAAAATPVLIPQPASAAAAPTSPPAAQPGTQSAGAAPRPAAAATAAPVIPPGGQAASPSAQGGPVTQAAATSAGAANEASRIEIRALADCWIQVRGSDAIVFSKVLKAGEAYHVPPRAGLLLRTGNAGALAISVDGKPTPSIGGAGTLRRSVALDPEALLAGTAIRG